ncbi:MAG TPA: ABC transporter substrate-binding protein [Geobacteraceae bacterium]|nr:ABC transporter substrate-binding protein [Geobacteraceae bacterium]
MVLLENKKKGHCRKKRTQWFRNYILFLSIFMVAIVASIPANAVQPEPSQTINNLNVALLQSMKKGSELGYEGRYRLLSPVIKDSFALSHTARMAAGGYWKTFSEEERSVYLKTYAEWTVATYAGRFDDYSGEQFKLSSESVPVRNTATVSSKLIESNRNEVEFNYQLRRMEGEWRIVDVRILDVSQLVLTKAQFVSILGLKGFNGLISMLNGKINDMSHSKGK